MRNLTLFFDEEHRIAAAVEGRVDWTSAYSRFYKETPYVTDVTSAEVTEYAAGVWLCAPKSSLAAKVECRIYVSPDADDQNVLACKQYVIDALSYPVDQVIKFEKIVEFDCPLVEDAEPRSDHDALEADKCTRDLTPHMRRYFLPFVSEELLVVFEAAKIVLNSPIMSESLGDHLSMDESVIEDVRDTLDSLMNSDIDIEKPPAAAIKDVSKLTLADLRRAAAVIDFADSLSRAVCEAGGRPMAWDDVRHKTIEELAVLVALNKVRFTHAATDDSKSDEELETALKLMQHLG